MEAINATLGKTFVQSVSICPTNRRYCNGKCKSCIAHMTPGAMSKEYKWVPPSRVKDILDYGKQAGAMTAIITSKSEPTLDLTDKAVGSRKRFIDILLTCREKIPQVDIHTNGRLLCENPDLLKMMVEEGGLNMITISLASFDPEKNRKFMGFDYDPMKVIKTARDLNIMVRCSVLLTKETCATPEELISYIWQAGERGVGMVVARQLWLPSENCGTGSEIENWCKANFVDMNEVQNAFQDAVGKIGKYDYKIDFIRHLPWGTPIFDVAGVNTTFAKCDEKPADGVFKSIQLVPFEERDGAITWAGTTQWGSRASRIL